MKETEKKVKKYLQERGWDNLRPGDLAKSISIESGELLELFQWYNPSLDEIKKDKVKLAQVKKELADVLLYCFDLSVSLGLNTEKIILDKLSHVKKKYPAKLMKNIKDREPGTDEVYWGIKNKYRKEGK